MTDNKHKQTSKFLIKGKWSYIFWYGAVLWGISTALIFQGIMLLSGNTSSVGFIISMIVFPLAGIFWGMFMWRHYNNQNR
ncbi:MAG: hypothetical protein ACQEQS_03145 [Thermodesulfobacteriota bacterium]